MSVNKAILLGHVGRDPEIRSMQNGSKVANISLATSRSWKDKTTGEKKEKTEWHRVVVFGDGLVGVVQQYVHKGSKLYIEGEIETRSWEANGQKKYTTEIRVDSFNGRLSLEGDGGGSKPAAYQNSHPGEHGGDEAPLDDDIPF